MKQITTIGLDLAKQVFRHCHVVDPGPREAIIWYFLKQLPPHAT